MRVLVDTCVWSLALRRNVDKLSLEEKAVVAKLTSLIDRTRAVMIGPVRQELLSGVRSESKFRVLQGVLNRFEHIPVLLGDYDEAARFENICRSNGLAVTPFDLLLCAVSIRAQMPIFTTDCDFSRIAAHVPLSLY